MSRAIAAAALVAVLPLAGCGAADDERDAREAVDRFHAALADRDGAGACSELTEAVRSELERQEGEPCDEAILSLDLPESAGEAAVAVAMSSASARLSGGATDFLDRTDAGWRISASGCRPTAPDLPFDCELKD